MLLLLIVGWTSSIGRDVIDWKGRHRLEWTSPIGRYVVDAVVVVDCIIRTSLMKGTVIGRDVGFRGCCWKGCQFEGSEVLLVGRVGRGCC